jgi:predicted metal-dependent peptidase
MKLQQQDPARRFRKVKLALMRHHKFMFLSSIMMLGTTQLVDDIPTACTNGRDEKYGLDFIEELDDYELGYVIAHENVHKACRHLVVYVALSKLNPLIANIAMDAWINNGLNKLDPKGDIIRMPMRDGKPVGVLMPEYDGWSVIEIFRDLMKKAEEQGSSTTLGGDGFDDHDWDGAEQMDTEELSELEQDIKTAISQGKALAKQAGAGAGGSVFGFDEIITPKIKWSAILTNFMRQSFTNRDESSFRKPNRRFLYQDIVMATLISQGINELVVAPDASGSMYGEPTKVALGAIKELAQQLNINKIHVLYWDGEVGSHEEYDDTTFKDFVITTNVIGGGGTTPACIPKYLKEKGIDPQAVVVLTDGEIYGSDWGQWEHPVIWCIVTNNNVTAPVGVTVKVEV